MCQILFARLVPNPSTLLKGISEESDPEDSKEMIAL
jgi:hypothetical protein